MKTVIHVTHEAVQKIGGIGAVLQGLMTSRVYRGAVKRDILMGPLFSVEGAAEHRLHGGTVLYSGLDGIRETPFAGDFARIEHAYGVKIVYGKKVFVDAMTGVRSEAEVLLIDGRHFDPEKMEMFKYILYRDYGIESGRYEEKWDYEQYCRIAEPGLEAVRAIGACEDGEVPVVMAHEYMGMPTALAARSQYPGQFRTIFYAHEVATVRRIVEEHPGHDTMFYNVMARAVAKGEYVEDVFGSQVDFYKHALVGASRFCDNIFAVGDNVVKELRFLRKEFEKVRIEVAYNGVPTRRVGVEEKMRSREKLREYCGNLLGFRPDFVFTHVTRLVASKGLWRDIRVMEQLERHLAGEGKSGVLFIVATATSARLPGEVMQMERGYQWPVAHREGRPDLTGGEAGFYEGVQAWNARGRFGKVVFINQFVTDAASLGSRAPAGIDFMDFRVGSDVEFGQSIYEPFGIAQLEPLSFGGICVFSSVCGCAGLVRKALAASEKEKGCANVMEVDYTKLPGKAGDDGMEGLMKMDRGCRDEIEKRIAGEVAAELFRRLPRSGGDFSRLIATGGRLGAEMSWDVVARDYIVPGMERAMGGSGGAVVS